MPAPNSNAEPIRVQAARVLDAVNRGASLDAALIRHLAAPEQNTEREPAFARALCYQALRHGWSNAALLARMSARPPRPLIAALLRAALTELRFMATPVHAAVAQSVAAARALDSGAAGFVNALLRRFLREREHLEAQLRSDDEVRLEHPRWLIEQFRADWPQQYEALCAGGNRAAPMWLRVDPRQVLRSEYQAQLAERGIASVAPAQPPQALLLVEAVAVEQLPGFAAGWVSVQDAAAQQVVAAMDARPGQRVLDACAAPGGKSAALAEQVPGLDLTVIERDPARCGRLRDTLQRCRVDATLLIADAAATSTWWDGRPFDRILIDAPCSGSGVIRRHPDIKHLRRPADIAALAAEQARLLDALWPLLAPGGRLTYATCSVLSAENQAQIAAFCRRTPTASVVPLLLPGFLPCGAGYQNLPGNGDQDGFFYASLQRSD
jgi:16S rRNA (cytosine967-C5)-methyltransferase